ncbi:MAG: hypothetical protein NVS1B10_04010 [Candidatus Saccharimonadales bacterium]
MINTISLSREVAAFEASLQVGTSGIEAYRLGGSEGIHAEIANYEQSLTDESTNTRIDQVLSEAINTPSENPRVESLKSSHPDEFAVGALFSMYLIRSKRKQQTRKSI